MERKNLDVTEIEMRRVIEYREKIIRRAESNPYSSIRDIKEIIEHYRKIPEALIG